MSKAAPDKIWLQWYEHDDEIVSTVTKEQINDTDIEYIRKDIYDKHIRLIKTVGELKEMILDGNEDVVDGKTDNLGHHIDI